MTTKESAPVAVTAGELLPCPFCDGPAVNVAGEYITCGSPLFIDCAGRGVRADAPEWDTRAALAQPRAAMVDGVERLIARADECQRHAEASHYPKACSEYRAKEAAFREAAKIIAALALQSPPAAKVEAVQRFVIRRNGAFFRPNAQGYTNHVVAAGFYTREEADHYADVESVTVEPLDRYRDEAERTIAEAQRLILALQPAAQGDADDA